MRKSLIAFALLLASGCSGPGFSAKDENYFAEQPYIAAKSGKYSISWKYGGMGCVFFPKSNVVDGELHFSLHATTSSGCVPGRLHSMPISKPEHVHALESKGAFWREPDGSKLRLEIRRQ